MKNGYLVVTRAVAIGATAGFFLLCSGMHAAHAQAAHQSDIAALKAEIDALKALIPSQSHAMADVDYHFSNLWFAVGNENWPLAEFYLNETKSHLSWAVRIRPVRRLSSGGQLELRPMLQAVENSGLASLKGSLDKRDRSAFDAAYRQTMNECFACHQAAEKPYLRPRVPESASSRIIDFRPSVAPR